MMAIAIEELQKALSSPPSMGDQWPFKDPPAVLAAREQRRKAGRPIEVQPNQVVRLVRFVKLGKKMQEACERAGLKRTTAQSILAGQHPIAHHPAVTAAGVFLPPMKPRAEGKPQ